MSGKRDSGAMKAAQAVRILALAAEDDFEAAKKKYRKRVLVWMRALRGMMIVMGIWKSRRF